MRMSIPDESSPVTTCTDVQSVSRRALPAERRVAIAAFYLNRDCDLERRAAIEAELGQAGLTGERICAVNGLAVPADLRGYFFDGDRLASRLKPGEVGCYASHLKALNLIVARGLDCALVLEDDALLPRDLAQSIEAILATLPEDWDFVHLCGDASRAIKPIAKSGIRGKLVRYSRIPGNTQGYLISRQGAQKFLVPATRYWPVDTDYRRPWQFGLQRIWCCPEDHRPQRDIGLTNSSLGWRAQGSAAASTLHRLKVGPEIRSIAQKAFIITYGRWDPSGGQRAWCRTPPGERHTCLV